MSLLSSSHLLLFQLPVLVLSCCIQSHTNSHIHIHSALSPHIRLQIMELSDPLTGRREGASMSNIRQDSLREVEGTKEERRGGEKRRGGDILLKWKWNRPIKTFHWELVCISSSAHTDYIYSTLWSNEYV